MPDPRGRAGAPWRRLGWILPAAMLLAVGLAIRLVLAGPGGLFAAILGLLILFPILWVLASALSPARPDRTCPECGSDTVERMTPKKTVGLQCRSCGWRDPSASAWLLAEEEGPLEELVLEERRRKREGSSKPVPSGVDTSTVRD